MSLEPCEWPCVAAVDVARLSQACQDTLRLQQLYYCMNAASRSTQHHKRLPAGHRRPDEARLLWWRSTAAFGASSHPGVRHAALRCAGAVFGRLQRLHTGTSDDTSSARAPATAAAADGGAAPGGAAAAAATSGVSAGPANSDAAAAAAGGSAEAAAGGSLPGSLDAAARWLLEAAEGGAGAGEAPELRLAVADAIAAAGDATCLSFAPCASFVSVTN